MLKEFNNFLTYLEKQVTRSLDDEQLQRTSLRLSKSNRHKHKASKKYNDYTSNVDCA
jgi:hypothetical protein